MTTDTRLVGTDLPRAFILPAGHRQRGHDGLPCAHAARLGPRPSSLTLVRLGQKSTRITPEPPYNPHRFCGGVATRLSPTGFIRTESALVLPPIIGAVRMKPYFVRRLGGTL